MNESTHRQLAKTQFQFTPNSGTVAGPVSCGVCGNQMLEQRGVTGPRSAAEAMGKLVSVYDRFLCPDSHLAWHKQVVAVRLEAQATSSQRLKDILEGEAQEVLLNHREHAPIA